MPAGSRQGLRKWALFSAGRNPILMTLCSLKLRASMKSPRKSKKEDTSSTKISKHAIFTASSPDLQNISNSVLSGLEEKNLKLSLTPLRIS